VITSTTIGKQRRLARIFDKESGRTVIAPLDDSLLAGPEGGLRDLESKILQVTAGGANAILGFSGLFSRYHAHMGTTGCILNVTASTIRSSHTRKVLVGSVQQAAEMDMDAVAVHVNIGSRYESEMLQTLGATALECQQVGMPLLALMYPRTERGQGEADDNYYDLLAHHQGFDRYAELVRHAVRIGVELGADIIKTPYTGTIESFQTVVESACDVPVVIAGGPEVDVSHIFQITYGAVKAGGAGIAGGRNAFHRRDSAALISALRGIVHDDVNPADALEQFLKSSTIDDGEPVYEADLPRGTTFAPEQRTTWIADDIPPLDEI
jgi:DhnA family fructose-bisphosphate aldolase class Ia